MLPEPLTKALIGSAAAVILAAFGVLGILVKNVAEASRARAQAASEMARAASDTAETARRHVAYVERQMELQRITFRLQARQLRETNSLLHTAQLERENDRTQWVKWAGSVQIAQNIHTEWDQEVVEQIERLGGHVREAPVFEAPPPAKFP